MGNVKEFVKFMKKAFEESDKKGLRGEDFLEYLLKKLDEYPDKDEELYSLTKYVSESLREYIKAGGEDVLSFTIRKIEEFYANKEGEHGEEDYSREEEAKENDDEEIESPKGIEISGFITLDELVKKITIEDDEDVE